MALTDYVPVPGEAPEYVAGLLMIAMAASLSVRRFADRLNRALVLYLVVAGPMHVFAALDDTEAVTELAAVMLSYFRIATPFALVYLAARFLEREAGWRMPRALGWTLVVLAVAAEATFFADHDLMYTDTPGPLYYAWPIGLAVSGAVGVGFAVLAGRAAPHRRTGLLVAAVAFSVEPAHMGLLFGAIGVAYGDFSAVVLAFCAAGVLGSAAIVPLRRAETRSGGTAATTMAALAAATALAMAAWARLAVAPDGLASAVQGVWQLALPALLWYALRRHQLFDIDLKVKWTISRGAVAAVLLGVFFVVASVAQNYFSDSMGWVAGGIATGVMLFAIHPLQRLGERVAHAALPGVEDTADWRLHRKSQVYRETLEEFLGDGALSRDEERKLARLADELGLGSERALEIRGEVETERGGAAP